VEAQGVRAAIAARLEECRLELHPEKTKIGQYLASADVGVPDRGQGSSSVTPITVFNKLAGCGVIP
jgi:hypothetical protein